MTSFRLGSGVLALFASTWLLGCGGAQHIEPYDENRCARASEGNSCVNFVYSVKPEIRKSVKGSLKGVLRWAVHKGGNVGLFGAGDNVALWGGDALNVDLSGTDATYTVTLDDVPAGRYQVLAYLDENENFISDGGEVVTFPKDPFGIPPNRDITVKILLDFIR
ncbi:MAG: DUF2141 domain-containing protein [Myxococcaceae bacterium]|nr:DUF2141 domain-containing protein [Myxococcaceae bacterium]